MSEQSPENRTLNPMPAWEIDGVPQEFKLFTSKVGEAAARIIMKDELLNGAHEEAGFEIPLTNIELMARVGAGVVVAALLEADMLKSDIADRLRTEYDDNGVSLFGISEEMHGIISGIAERTIYSSPDGAEGS